MSRFSERGSWIHFGLREARVPASFETSNGDVTHSPFILKALMRGLPFVVLHISTLLLLVRIPTGLGTL